MHIRENQDYEITFKGVKLHVRRGVFSPDPKITNSSSIILNNLPDIKNKDILDVGCGSGIIGIYCAMNGARKVIAVDIDEKAVDNTLENARRNKVENKVEVKKSSLFENVIGTFDYIFGNLPIDEKSWDLGISTIDLMKKFISKSRKYLNNDGKIYFTWYDNDNLLLIRKYLIENNYKYNEIKENKKSLTWYLFEVNF